MPAPFLARCLDAYFCTVILVADIGTDLHTRKSPISLAVSWLKTPKRTESTTTDVTIHDGMKRRIPKALDDRIALNGCHFKRTNTTNPMIISPTINQQVILIGCSTGPKHSRKRVNERT